MKAIFAAALIALAATAEGVRSEDQGHGFWKPYENLPPEGRHQNRPQIEETLTDAEIEALPRDQRRTKYIEGFSCSMYIYGQLGFVRFEPGGVGYLGHQEGDVKFSWWIEDDEYCTQYPSQVEPVCSLLPKRRLPDERATFRQWLTESCV